jgi:uncharacterized coiled-coil DUF342 family protein
VAPVTKAPAAEPVVPVKATPQQPVSKPVVTQKIEAQPVAQPVIVNPLPDKTVAQGTIAPKAEEKVTTADPNKINNKAPPVVVTTQVTPKTTVSVTPSIPDPAQAQKNISNEKPAVEPNKPAVTVTAATKVPATEPVAPVKPTPQQQPASKPVASQKIETQPIAPAVVNPLPDKTVPQGTVAPKGEEKATTAEPNKINNKAPPVKVQESVSAQHPTFNIPSSKLPSTIRAISVTKDFRAKDVNDVAALNPNAVLIERPVGQPTLEKTVKAGLTPIVAFNSEDLTSGFFLNYSFAFDKLAGAWALDVNDLKMIEASAQWIHRLSVEHKDMNRLPIIGILNAKSLPTAEALKAVPSVDMWAIRVSGIDPAGVNGGADIFKEWKTLSGKPMMLLVEQGNAGAWRQADAHKDICVGIVAGHVSDGVAKTWNVPTTDADRAKVIQLNEGLKQAAVDIAKIEAAIKTITDPNELFKANKQLTAAKSQQTYLSRQLEFSGLLEGIGVPDRVDGKVDADSLRAISDEIDNKKDQLGRLSEQTTVASISDPVLDSLNRERSGVAEQLQNINEKLSEHLARTADLYGQAAKLQTQINAKTAEGKGLASTIEDLKAKINAPAIKPVSIKEPVDGVGIGLLAVLGIISAGSLVHGLRSRSKKWMVIGLLSGLAVLGCAGLTSDGFGLHRSSGNAESDQIAAPAPHVDVTSLQAQLQGLEQKQAEITSTIEDLKNQVSDIHAQLATVMNASEALKADKAKLTKSAEDLDKAFAEFKKQEKPVGAKDAVEQTLAQQKKALETTLAQLELKAREMQENYSLEVERGKISQARKDLEESRQDLKLTIEDLKNMDPKELSPAEALKAINDLETDIARVKIEYGRIERDDREGLEGPQGCAKRPADQRVSQHQDERGRCPC